MNPLDGTIAHIRARTGAPGLSARARPIGLAALSAAALLAGAILLALLGLLAPAARAQTIAGGTAVPGAAGTPEAVTEAEAPEAPPVAEATPVESTESGAISAIASSEPLTVLSSGGLTLRAHSAVLRGQVLDLDGTATVAEATRTVALERYVPAREAWFEVAHALVAANGAVRLRWRPKLAGEVSLRATVLASAQISSKGPRKAVARALTASGSEPLTVPGAATVTVYKPATATWYGPGMYGNETACGQILTPGVIGVANRTLPCGTMIDVSYGGSHLAVPVIDRGPYSGLADWDLTAGAAEALGITATAHIGTLVLGSALVTPSLGLPAFPEATPEETATGGAAAAA